MEAASASEARRFGKYTLVAKLATGGMAEIFLARLHGDGGFEKLVCIKRILPHLAKDPQFVAMFLDEARVAARISHPNVCQVFELGEWEGQYYIAMEYLEGVPLAVYRRKEFYPGLPDPRLVAAFGVQACEGLHHAHQLKRSDGELLGVVHRDISPSNLFATTDGIVKVLDFGIAKVQDASVRTSTGAVKGTYAYMAPEQLRNEQIDRRVDVWAMGAVLWETLAQQYLFRRETEFLTFEAIAKLPIPNICEVRPDVAPLLADVIARALSRRPDDRFATARALGEALSQAVGPLGGALSQAAISDEVSSAFEGKLAEQRMLIRIAREGGQFDLEASSPLVGHGTRLSTTPVSSLQRRVEEARAEVANFVAATQAIDSLVQDEELADERPARFGTDGSFTPAPSRRVSRQVDTVPDFADPTEPVSDETEVDPSFDRARRRSQPMAAARREWRYDESDASIPAAAIPAGPRTSAAMAAQRVSAAMPAAPASKLPWMIALVAVVAAAASGVMFYMKERDQAPVAIKTDPVPMPALPAAIPDAAVTDAPAVVAEAPPTDAAVAVIEEPVVEKPKSKRTDKKLDKRPDDKSVAGPPGFITIDSKPVYAVIYIDGKKYGETPLVNIKLPPGKHQVRAVSPSGSTRTTTITIESGKTAPVRRIEW